jgi:hypothetical protein
MPGICSYLGRTELLFDIDKLVFLLLSDPARLPPPARYQAHLSLDVFQDLPNTQRPSKYYKDIGAG